MCSILFPCVTSYYYTEFMDIRSLICLCMCRLVGLLLTSGQNFIPCEIYFALKTGDVFNTYYTPCV